MDGRKTAGWAVALLSATMLPYQFCLSEPASSSNQPATDPIPAPAATQPAAGSIAKTAVSQSAPDSDSTPTISGSSGYVVGTPKLDLESLQNADPAHLQGQVSEARTTGSAQGQLMLPAMDCVGFAGQLNVDGGALLRGRASKGKPGWDTDGGAWIMSGDYPVMCTIYPGDSLEACGMKPGDTFVELNGVSTYQLSHDSILGLFRSYDSQRRNHYVIKRGNQLIRIVSQITWHTFGSGSAEESLWKSTWQHLGY
jgi:hypothetical protein